jgi:hypothetical protein
MAFPLLALPVLAGAGFLIYKGVKPSGFKAFESAVQGNRGAGTPQANRRTELTPKISSPIVDAVARLGNIVGEPTAPGLNIVSSGFTVQSFKRKSDGDDQIIIHQDGARKAFLVRGGFYDLYTGNEKWFGVPTSDEYDTVEPGRMGTDIRVRKQDFTKGSMKWIPGKKSRLIGYATAPMMGINGKRFGPARLHKFYDSSPARRQKAWYEKAWDGITEEVTLGDVVFVGTMIGLGTGTAVVCVVTLGIGCAPAAGAFFSAAIPIACASATGADAASKSTGIESEKKDGFTTGVCSVM